MEEYMVATSAPGFDVTGETADYKTGDEQSEEISVTGLSLGSDSKEDEQSNELDSSGATSLKSNSKEVLINAEVKELLDSSGATSLNSASKEAVNTGGMEGKELSSSGVADEITCAGQEAKGEGVEDIPVTHVKVDTISEAMSRGMGVTEEVKDPTRDQGSQTLATGEIIIVEPSP